MAHRVLSVTLATMVLCGALLAQQAQPQTSTAPQPQTPQAQQPMPNPAAGVPEAKPEDVKSVEAIVAALYDVISGPPGPRDWKRFHSLFLPNARMMPSGINDKGEWRMREISPDDYEKRAGEMFLKEGFFETGIAAKIEQYGTIAHVFTTYESRHEKGGQPFARGINSLQLLFDGKRWYIANITWQSETPKLPIPQEYMK